MTNIPVLSGISNLADNYDAFIVDLWGVVFEGNRPYDGVIDALIALSQANKKVVFLTNSSRRSEIVASTLEAVGLTRNLYYGLLSSGEVIHYEMKARQDSFFKNLGYNYFHIGAKRITGIVDGLNYKETPTIAEADFILLTGLPFSGADETSLRPVLERSVDLRLPMICCNPDVKGIASGVAVPGSGSIANYYERLGGVVFRRGKPDPRVFKYCLEGLPEYIYKERTVVIGDSFETDLIGADKAGLDSVLIASGVHRREIKMTLGALPDSENITDLARHYGVFPRAAVPYFVW
ncbi:MAG: TIGR01459 family HAD-type hydrolase [Alphaproteobacteria bacterium]